MAGKAAQSAGATPKDDGGSGELQVEVEIMGETFAVDPKVKEYLASVAEGLADRCDRVTELEADLSAVSAERDQLARSLRSQKGAATKARNAIVEMEEAAKPRAIGALKPEAALAGVDLKGAVDCADEVVLAFSDGKAELRGVKPGKVLPRDFAFRRGGLLFDCPDLVVTGPGGDLPTQQLAGVALLIDGEQVAWSPLAQPIELGAGASFNLTGSVIFR